MTRFRSKVDVWLIVLMLISLGMLTFAAYDVMLAEMAGWQRALILLTLILSALLFVWLMMATYYEVAADRLTIVSGPFRWRIELTDIESVEPSRSLLSSPALSLDRLKIRYCGRQVMVSPADKAAFIAALGPHVGQQSGRRS